MGKKWKRSDSMAQKCDMRDEEINQNKEKKKEKNSIADGR